ncbi:anaerobic sulfite reductase subunit AsrA [Aeromonas veronii]|uniref:anaerobic sulfite reductase subunit AsrA n=1 Tax=Aeromonas veronii TaxID=654 RepID=UPI00214E36D1|nr:anaerobic sulfite reductase subunit AsrA [Aeromonas veronii]MCR3960127.1 anaerobic sulfite reductase subunit AsrA [Aeromonas veronii]
MSFLLTHPALAQLFERLLPDYRIMAPAAEYRGGRFSDTDNVTYHSIRHPADLVWQEKSHFSPKEVVLPITQTLFHFDNLELRESKVEAKPTLLFLRSCDIHALRRLDQVYLKNGQNSDVYYARLRSKLKLVLLECRESFENCFCVSMGSNETQDYAAAIRLSDEGARIEVKDPELLGYFAELGESDDFTPEFVQSNPVKVRTPDSICDDPQRIRQILTAHPVWAEYNSRCIGCGRCTTSCPTCSCYSVHDLTYAENPQQGERRRQWASCMVDGFSDMAGGHGFRAKHGERLRYRALHKVNDYKARQGEEHMCVGCGRCDDRCPHYISFSNIINKMTDVVEQTIAADNAQGAN